MNPILNKGDTIGIFSHSSPASVTGGQRYERGKHRRSSAYKVVYFILN